MWLNWSAFKRTPKLYRSIEEAEAERNPNKVRSLWLTKIELESLRGRLRQFSRLERLEFRWCPNLEDCYRRETNVTFSPELRAEILELRRLKSFIILNTPVREIPMWLAPLPKLGILWVRGTEVREIPAEIRLFSQLRELELGNNDICEVPVEIAQLRRLEFLGLHSTLVAEIPLPVLQMPKLRGFQLTNTAFSLESSARVTEHFSHAFVPPTTEEQLAAREVLLGEQECHSKENL